MLRYRTFKSKKGRFFAQLEHDIERFTERSVKGLDQGGLFVE